MILNFLTTGCSPIQLLNFSAMRTVFYVKSRPTPFSCRDTASRTTRNFRLYISEVRWCVGRTSFPSGWRSIARPLLVPWRRPQCRLPAYCTVFKRHHGFEPCISLIHFNNFLSSCSCCGPVASKRSNSILGAILAFPTAHGTKTKSL